MVHDCDLITAQTPDCSTTVQNVFRNKEANQMCSQHHISESEFEQEHPFFTSCQAWSLRS